MIRKKYVGQPSNIPKGALLLGSVTFHYRTGTQCVYYYTDDLNSQEDIEEHLRAEKNAEKINSQEWGIWE